jgi:hypothetical protein
MVCSESHPVWIGRKEAASPGHNQTVGVRVSQYRCTPFVGISVRPPPCPIRPPSRVLGSLRALLSGDRGFPCLPGFPDPNCPAVRGRRGQGCAVGLSSGRVSGSACEWTDSVWTLWEALSGRVPLVQQETLAHPATQPGLCVPTRQRSLHVTLTHPS